MTSTSPICDPGGQCPAAGCTSPSTPISSPSCTPFSSASDPSPEFDAFRARIPGKPRDRWPHQATPTPLQERLTTASFKSGVARPPADSRVCGTAHPPHSPKGYPSRSFPAPPRPTDRTATPHNPSHPAKHSLRTSALPPPASFPAATHESISSRALNGPDAHNIRIRQKRFPTHTPSCSPDHPKTSPAHPKTSFPPLAAPTAPTHSPHTHQPTATHRGRNTITVSRTSNANSAG